MARPVVRIAARLVSAAVLAVGPSIAVHLALNATGPLTAVAVWAGVFAGVIVLESEVPRYRRALRWALVVLAGFGALVLVADMVIIPLSAYLLWFELVPEGNARGAVSFVYVMLAAYGSALFGATVTRRPLAAVAAYLAWLSFLSIPILGRSEPMLILLGASVVVVVAAVVRGRPLRPAVRAGSQAVVLLALAVLAAAGLAGITSPQGSRFVDRVLSPRFREIVVSVFPSFPIMYDIPGYGFRLPTEDIGRSPVLSNRAIFRVSGVEMETIYLRTEVFHHFSGSSWAVSGSLEAEAEPEVVLEADEPGGPALLEVIERTESAPTRQIPARRVEVTVLADFYSVVPHTLDTVAVGISGRERLRLRRSGETLGYHLVDPLLYGDRVTLYREPRRGDAEPPDDLYLDVPERVREDLADLAAGLRDPDDARTIVNTLRFLREEFEYTLEPPRPADQSRFVTAFLEEHRRGYCVHFATAFTMLSRMQGIPTRYVTGFLVQPPTPEEFATGFEMFDDVTVTGYSAHAWAEVWLPEIGWRIVEATPPMQPVGYENTFFDRYAAIRDEGRTVMQLREILRQDLRDEPDGPGFRIDLPALSLWVLVVPLIGLGGAGLIVLLRRRDTGRRFRATVRQLRDRSVRAGFPPPERVGWTGWADARNGHAARVADIVLSVCFGERPPTRRDLRFLRHWHRWYLARRR